MSQVKLEANIRKETGTGVAKKLRREGRIPAVLYGHHLEQPIILDVDSKATEQVLASHGKSAIITLALNNDQVQDQLAMLTDYQRDVFGTCLLHVDFKQVRMDETVKATIPVVVTGESIGVKAGGVIEQQLREIEIECLPLNLPSYITVDITALDLGHHLTVGDLVLPENVTVLAPENEQVVSIAIPRSVAAEDSETAEASAEPKAE